MSFVHFHSYPILSRASQEKVREIAALLARYQQHSRLALVPFGDLQQQVVLAVRPELRVVIYRRLMLRIAERLARRWRAKALVTGEVVGQVASQTLDNLTVIADACELAFTGDTIDAARALEIGLVSRVVKPESLMEETMSLARRIARHPADGVRMTKRLLRMGRNMQINHLLEVSAAMQALATIPPTPHTANPVPLQNEPVVEFDRKHNPLRDDLLVENFSLRDGHLDVPTGPGLGVTVNELVLRKYAVAA